MKLILARHAETQANKKRIFSGWTDYPLTEKGQAQAERLAYELKKNYNIDEMYSSPLERAMTTSRQISKSIERKIITTECLKEVNFGLFEGKTQIEIGNHHEDHWNSWQEDYVNYRIPEGENLMDLLSRIKPLIDNLRSTDKTCLLVAHSGVIQVAITYLLGIDLKKMWNFQVKNCSYVEFECSDDFAFIKQLWNMN